MHDQLSIEFMCMGKKDCNIVAILNTQGEYAYIHVFGYSYEVSSAARHS